MNKNPITRVFGFLGGLLHAKPKVGFCYFALFQPVSFSNLLFLSFLGIFVISCTQVLLGTFRRPFRRQRRPSSTTNVLFTHGGALLGRYGASPASEGALLTRARTLFAHHDGAAPFQADGSPPSSKGALLTQKCALFAYNGTLLSRCGPSKSALLARIDTLRAIFNQVSRHTCRDCYMTVPSRPVIRFDKNKLALQSPTGTVCHGLASIK